MFHLRYLIHFVYHYPSVDLWVPVNHAVMNVCVQVFDCVLVFNFLDIYIRVELLSHMVNLYLTF